MSDFGPSFLDLTREQVIELDGFHEFVPVVEDRKRLDIFDRIPVCHQAIDEVDLALRKGRIRDELGRLKLYDADTFDHSVAVSLLATHLALNDEKLVAEDRRLLTQGALLHDIGKTAVPLSIINPARAEEVAVFTHDEILEKVGIHPVEGYKRAHGAYQDEVDLRTRRIVPLLVLAHHRFNQDTGRPVYPVNEVLDGLVDEGVLDVQDRDLVVNGDPALSALGKILGLSDGYHAMTSGRSYNKGKFADPTVLLEEMEAAYPDMDSDIQEIMSGIHLVRFPDCNWMVPITVGARL
jgi:putative nucleotidyltransferase with HDIG domain